MPCPCCSLESGSILLGGQLHSCELGDGDENQKEKRQREKERGWRFPHDLILSESHKKFPVCVHAQLLQSSPTP